MNSSLRTRKKRKKLLKETLYEFLQFLKTNILKTDKGNEIAPLAVFRLWVGLCMLDRLLSIFRIHWE